MPRFDNEGFNPQKRIDNDTRDRSVPVDENYYGNVPIDLDFNSRTASNSEVRDNQTNNQPNARQYGNNLEAPRRSERQNDFNFVPEVQRDYDAERRQRNAERSQKQSKKRQAPQRRKPPKGYRAHQIRMGIAAFIVLLILIPSLLIGSVLGKINYDQHIDNKYVASSDLARSPFVKNILLLGVDARPKEESETSRADTMMLISLDMKHKCIKMTSFLRDTWVYIPEKDGNQRLNAASTYGGYSGVVDTIEYNFGVEIDGYVIADFEMFKVLVDSIGGVEVSVTKKEAKEVTKHKKRYGNVVLEEGKHVLTGEQALAYCRIRKIDTDFKRTERQRTVMTSILNGAKHAGPFTLYKMAKNSAPYIETDLSKMQLVRIAGFAAMCLGNKMVQQRVPFDGTWEYATKGGASVISVNTDKNKALLIDSIYNKTADEIEAAKTNK